MIKIDKNVPLPGKGPKAENDILKTTLESMAPGDSFVTPPGLQVNRIRRAAEELGVRVKIGKDENGRRRCWRVGEMKNTEMFEAVIKPKLLKKFRAAGIVCCVNCGKGPDDPEVLGFAHKYKRNEIPPDDIKELSNVVRICHYPCHDTIENGTNKRKLKPGGGWEPWTHAHMARAFDEIKLKQDELFFRGQHQ